MAEEATTFLAMDGKPIQINGWFFNRDYWKKVWNLDLQQTEGGLISADVHSGYNGDIVTLSNTPSAGYQFNSYGITGAELTGNTFAFSGSNVTAEATFEEQIYNLTYTNNGHGTLTGNSNTAKFNDVITLTASPDQDYAFSGYKITGATLTGNQFRVENNDVTAYAAFSAITPKSAAYYSNTAANAGTTTPSTLSINKAVTAYNYFTLKFNHRVVNSVTSFADYINVNFNTGTWTLSSNYQAGNYKPVRYGATFTAANNNVKSKTVNNNTLRYYTSIADTTSATCKLVVDRSRARCSAFWNNTYLGYGNVNSNITAVKSVVIGMTSRGATYGDKYYLAGFNTLAKAVTY